jgi:hypothetical protein
LLAVTACFTKIAADLAGIVLSHEELAAQASVTTAEIVNHQQHDPSQAKLVLNDDDKRKGCAIQ